MHTINLTDLPARQCCCEEFGGACRVLSRSGLHPTERALIAALPPRFAGHALIVGNRTGALGLLLAAGNPAATVTQHAVDLHHVKSIQRALTANRGVRIDVVCSPFLPDAPAADLAFVQATSADTPAELLLDQLEDLHARLRAGATCHVAYDGKPDWLRKQMRQIFGSVSAIPATEGVTLFRAAKATPPLPEAAASRAGGTRSRASAVTQERDPPEKVSRAPREDRRRSFAATFPASLPGDAALAFTTLPGVFAHRRADEGGLALAEVAARGLQPGARVLDMGCGCGLVGILLARHAAVAEVLAVDSNARAVHCTAQNAAANGVANLRTLLTDTGVEEGGFALFAGNPPYYSDFRIADLFLRTAHAALVPGGLAFVVAKNHRQLTARMQEVFGNAEVIPRRGYGVVKSVRT